MVGKRVHVYINPTAMVSYGIILPSHEYASGLPMVGEIAAIVLPIAS